MPPPSAVSKVQEARFNLIETNNAQGRSWMSVTCTESMEEPPKYASALSPPATSQFSRPVTALEPGLEFVDYRPLPSIISEDKGTCTAFASQLTDDPRMLYECLQKQLRMPPRPVVRILGTHSDWFYSWGNTKVDFDLLLDIMPLIYPPAGFRENAPVTYYPAEAGDLATQVKDFCDDERDCRVFTIKRRVTGWDTDFLEQNICALIESTKYSGDVAVTFPVHNSQLQVLKAGLEIDVHDARSQHSTRYRWRKGSKQAEKKVSEDELVTRAVANASKHGEIHVDWPYSKDNISPSLLDTPPVPLGSMKCYTAQSEQDWWAVWKEPIKNGVLRGRQCWVTMEDWKDVVMGHVHVEVPAKMWGTSTDDWATFSRAFRWPDKHTARQYLHETGLYTMSRSRNLHLAGVGGF